IKVDASERSVIVELREVPVRAEEIPAGAPDPGREIVDQNAFLLPLQWQGEEVLAQVRIVQTLARLAKALPRAEVLRREIELRQDILPVVENARVQKPG